MSRKDYVKIAAAIQHCRALSGRVQGASIMTTYVHTVYGDLPAETWFAYARESASGIVVEASARSAARAFANAKAELLANLQRLLDTVTDMECPPSDGWAAAASLLSAADRVGDAEAYVTYRVH